MGNNLTTTTVMTHETDPLIKDINGKSTNTMLTIDSMSTTFEMYKNITPSDLKSDNKNMFNEMFKEVLSNQIVNFSGKNQSYQYYVPLFLKTQSKNYMNIIVDFSPSLITNTLKIDHDYLSWQMMDIRKFGCLPSNYCQWLILTGYIDTADYMIFTWIKNINAESYNTIGYETFATIKVYKSDYSKILFSYRVNKIENYSKRTMLEELNDLVLVGVDKLN
jgi:hypothetical protein